MRSTKRLSASRAASEMAQSLTQCIGQGESMAYVYKPPYSPPLNIKGFLGELQTRRTEIAPPVSTRSRARRPMPRHPQPAPFKPLEAGAAVEQIIEHWSRIEGETGASCACLRRAGPATKARGLGDKTRSITRYRLRRGPVFRLASWRQIFVSACPAARHRRPVHHGNAPAGRAGPRRGV
jgi:hypothetical protein